MTEMNTIKQQQIAADQKLNDQRAKGTLTQQQYDDELASSDAYFLKLKDDTVNGWKAMDAAQSSWLNGAKKALKDYEDAGQNVAGLTQSFFISSFDNMTNALTNFATTGKLSFKSLVASILADLAKMEMRIAMSKALSSMFGGGTDTSAGGGGAQMASIFDGGWGGIAKGGAFDATG